MSDQERIDYQQTIRNLRDAIADLRSEMHEVADALVWGDITPLQAAKRLNAAIDGEVANEP